MNIGEQCIRETITESAVIGRGEGIISILQALLFHDLSSIRSGNLAASVSLHVIELPKSQCRCFPLHRGQRRRRRSCGRRGGGPRRNILHAVKIHVFQTWGGELIPRRRGSTCILCALTRDISDARKSEMEARERCMVAMREKGQCNQVAFCRDALAGKKSRL
jgi:hypothetical protein